MLQSTGSQRVGHDRATELKELTTSTFVFVVVFNFFNYESMVTHLQETWKIQKVTYSSTMYYNYFFK